MCSFNGIVSRETKKYIQKWSKGELKFKKLNAPSNQFILIEIDVFDDFIRAHGIGKRSEVKSFRKFEILVEAITKKLHEDIK